MGDLREISIAVARVVLGMVILIAGLIGLDILVYITATGSTFDERVAAAYEAGRSNGYAETYPSAYQEVYGGAYDKGLDKEYEIRVALDSKESTSSRVELRNPTYQELREFLAGDQTDSNPYIKGDYVCFDFAAELNNNAEASGIRAAYVRISFREWAHAVAAFETVDRGLIFIEPQTDKDVGELVINRPYPWQTSGAERTRKYDDLITEIQIMW